MPNAFAPRSELKPLNHKGQAVDGALGTWRGSAQALNVWNPQPGFRYYRCKHPRTRGGMSEFQRFINLGYEACGAGSPEYSGQPHSQLYSELGVDPVQVFGDIVLLRISEEVYRKNVAEPKLRQNEVARTGATDTFIEQGRELEARFGPNAGGPIYRKGPGHGDVSG